MYYVVCYIEVVHQNMSPRKLVFLALLSWQSFTNVLCVDVGAGHVFDFSGHGYFHPGVSLGYYSTNSDHGVNNYDFESHNLLHYPHGTVKQQPERNDKQIINSEENSVTIESNGNDAPPPPSPSTPSFPPESTATQSSEPHNTIPGKHSQARVENIPSSSEPAQPSSPPANRGLNYPVSSNAAIKQNLFSLINRKSSVPQQKISYVSGVVNAVHAAKLPPGAVPTSSSPSSPPSPPQDQPVSQAPNPLQASSPVPEVPSNPESVPQGPSEQPPDSPIQYHYSVPGLLSPQIQPHNQQFLDKYHNFGVDPHTESFTNFGNNFYTANLPNIHSGIEETGVGASFGIYSGGYHFGSF